MTQQDTGQLRLDVGDEIVGYRGPTVTRIVGITYRQLDYWARTGLVEPTYRRAEGSGTQRLYSFEDIVRLRVVKRLLDTGVSLQKVRLAVDELRQRGGSIDGTTLISDGSTVYAVDDDSTLLDLLKRGQAVFALDLDPVVDQLRGEVASFPTERVVEGGEPIISEADADVVHPIDGGPAAASS